MKPFAYQAPADAATAVRSVAADPSAMFLGGGTNLVDHLKLGVATPHLIVDVTAATSDEIVDDGAGGLRIGSAKSGSWGPPRRWSTRCTTPPESGCAISRSPWTRCSARYRCSATTPGTAG